MMKKMNNIYKVLGKKFRIGALAAALLAPASCFVACSDFLSIEPLNDIVLENYWTEEADVVSLVTSCYAQLESADCIQRMIVWGESRSDNMQAGAGTPNDLNQVFKENILETNGYTKWQCFYQVINRCNTVIHYAPSVNAKDPNFTDSELRATIAEATALRTLSYFYLIRAFRDVPYSTAPSKEDNQVYQLPATKFEAVLDSLITDMEKVKNDAVKSYGEDSPENVTRITRSACYALLADLYLWKGDWQKCIDNCDLVIEQKIRQYQDEYEKDPTTVSAELYGKYPLISELPVGSTRLGNAYNKIFGDGESFESIFELSFENNQSVENSSVSNFYGRASSLTGQIGVPSIICADPFGGTNDYFRKTDCRYLENIYQTNNKGYVNKYVANEVSFNASNSTGGKPSVETTISSRSYSNWIVYRLTDVMLMRAEALVEMAGDVKQGETLTDEQTSLYRKAFSCVSAVWKRANNKRISTIDTLVYDNYATSRLAMEDLVLEERQRELMFEGKRWFDLVRLCRREGENTRMLSRVVPKFQENGAAIRIKLSSADILYWPYNRNELKSNLQLQQNPAYATETSEKNF